MSDEPQRPNPDELLSRVQADERQQAVADLDLQVVDPEHVGDGLLARPLDTYPFAREIGNAVEDLLTPEDEN